MVEYVCNNCDKVFKKKCNYEGHLNRKTPCNPKNSHDHPHQCPYCDHRFKKKANFRRHLDNYSCRKDEKPTVIAPNMIIHDNSDHRANVNIDNSNNNSITHNAVQLMPYDKSNYDKIPDEIAYQCIKTGFDCVPNFIKHTHFNDKFPEMQNIRMTNWRSPDIDVYEHGAWNKKDGQETALQLMHDAHNHLEERYDVIKNTKFKGKKAATNYFEEFYHNQKPTEKIVTKKVKRTVYNGHQKLLTS